MILIVLPVFFEPNMIITFRENILVAVPRGPFRFGQAQLSVGSTGAAMER